MTEFNGISSSPGYAIGKAFIYRHDKLVISHDYIPIDSVSKELEHLDSCFKSLIKEYKGYLDDAEGDSEKALYTVELLMLEDAEYHKSIKKLIEEKRYSAPWAAQEATEEIIRMISGIEDEYLKERIIDIRDIEYVILETLTGKRREHIVVRDKRVLVADYILTSELLGLEGLENIEGIVLEDHSAVWSGTLAFLAIDRDGTRSGVQESGDHAEERGLSASGRPDYADELTLVDVDAEVLDGDGGRVVGDVRLVEVPDGDEGVVPLCTPLLLGLELDLLAGACSVLCLDLLCHSIPILLETYLETYSATPVVSSPRTAMTMRPANA